MLHCFINRHLTITAKKRTLLSSVQETVIGLGMFSLAILGPSGWILSHLEDYKKRE